MVRKSNKSASKVWIPPETAFRLPIRPRLQVLPLNELPWELFQRLCARLAQRSGDVEFSQEYGIPGQDQEGIDVYVRLRSTGRYSVWQCKRYQEVARADIKGAVDDFIAGTWLTKSDEFVICVSAPTEESELADEIEVQNQRLRAHGVALIPKGITQLSGLLKENPDLVDDFLGREWVREFCGQEVAERLSRRVLSPEQIIRLRALLRRCYAQHFETVDPGLPSLTSAISGGPRPLPLAERFILPDVLEPRQVSQTQAPSVESQPKPDSWSISTPSLPPFAESPATREPSRMVTATVEMRRPALEWVIEGELSAVIGDPGIGKSSLLRYLLLDLLSPEPQHESLAIKWGNRLPVWIPFPMWTRMVAESESGCSLSDVLKTWLCRLCAPESLVTLVQQALEDSRLLLIVDGLDEWSNETAARTTVTMLEQFVGERDVPAIASSRPLGFERLGGLSGKWRRARLAGLTTDQQREYAYRWFLHQARGSTSSSGHAADQETQKFADTEAKELIEDLQQNGRLARLAEVPLLLSGLIALSVQHVRLPRSRFKAYEELTRLLLQEQPQRREKAAHARVSSSRLSQETREGALARLAYLVHQAPGSDAIDKGSARGALRDFLVTLLHKPAAEALELADQVLVVGAETVGILVEKSPQEVGFLHRAFQEFLAARHLSNLPFYEQKQRVAYLISDSQWHDILLCLCHLNTRTGEVDELVNIIRETPLPLEFEPARQSFLAEVAFGDLHCSAPVALSLASTVFTQIETGTWMPLRERLLEHALDGLLSDVLRDETEARVQCWYPDRHRARSDAYRAIATWPREPETVEALWRGLFDEDEWNQRAAAEALAQNSGGDAPTGARLLRLLFSPVELSVIASGLHALCLGWPREPKIPELLQEARENTDWTLAIVAINHRVKRSEYDLQDREALLEFTTGIHRSGWRWTQDAIEALLTGWPKDTELKSMAIRSLTSHGAYNGPLSREFCGPFLMQGFPQDDQVAAAIADLFRHTDYPQNVLGLHSDWTPLVKTFAEHTLLRDAVDDWLEKKQDRFWDCALCLVSKSPRAKRFLLKPDKKAGVITEYQARWLLEGWQMDDPEVAEVLSKLVQSSTAPSVAHLLPEIVANKEACRHRLLDWLRTEGDDIAQRALIGLIKLGCDERDTEVVEAAVQKFAGQVPSGVRWWGVSDVIAHFPHHPRVRELALHQVKNRKGDIGVAAFAYKDDPEMRREVLKRISPLPVCLRLHIVDRLTRRALEGNFAHQLLSDYDEDMSGQVKTSAAIGYAHSVRERGEDEAALIQKLSEGIRAVGPDLAERRQAAFAGLLDLDRLDVLANAVQSDPGIFRHMDFSSLVEINLRLASQLAKHWGRVNIAFGSSFLDRIGYTPDDFLEEIASQVKDTDLIETIIAKMAKNTGVSPRVAGLRIRSRQWRGTDKLRRLCIDLVAHFLPRSWVDSAPSIMAAEILSEQFAGDTATKQELEAVADKVPNPTPLIIALCNAWPDSPAIEKLSDKQKYKSLLLPAKIHLLCRSVMAKEFAKQLGQILARLTGNIWEFLPSCARPILSRFERDLQVREEAFQRLETDATAAEKANLSLLLHRTDTRVDRLGTWCREEFRRQTSGEHLPEFALEIFSGRIRPIGHVLLELLTS
jgi:hypothetical protein